jgi:hypothetical protein
MEWLFYLFIYLFIYLEVFYLRAPLDLSLTALVKILRGLYTVAPYMIKCGRSNNLRMEMMISTL